MRLCILVGRKRGLRAGTVIHARSRNFDTVNAAEEKTYPVPGIPGMYWYCATPDQHGSVG